MNVVKYFTPASVATLIELNLLDDYVAWHMESGMYNEGGDSKKYPLNLGWHVDWTLVDRRMGRQLDRSTAASINDYILYEEELSEAHTTIIRERAWTQ
jgi:hypothetical protein